MMCVYTVVLSASHSNSGYRKYTQKIEAFLNDELCAIQFDDNNYIGSCFPIQVMEKMVKAETGAMACWKFFRWQQNGFNEKYLLGEVV
jgi:hypothetical protein